MKAKKIYEFNQNGDPYITMGIGSLQVLRDFLKNHEIFDWRGNRINIGYYIDNRVKIEPRIICNYWNKFPKNVQDKLKERAEDQLPNYTKNPEELMKQIYAAVNILENIGFKILEVPKKVTPTQATIKVRWTYKYPNNPSFRDFSIFKTGYIRYEVPIMDQAPLDTYQELAYKLIDYVDKQEQRILKRYNKNLFKS